MTAFARRVLHLDLVLADWAFARDLARRRTVAHAARVRRFADEVIATTRRRDADEIALIGHSLGAVFAVQALAEALRAIQDCWAGRHA
jgi:pimeloyl-ACP methyl ester carboxylesterase